MTVRPGFRAWALPLLALLTAVGTGFFGAWTYGEQGIAGDVELLETQAWDRLFSLRRRWRPGSPPIDPRIRLITLDREAEQQLGQPGLLWTRQLAQTSRDLLQAGALGVGLDYATDPVLDKSPPALRQWLEEGYAELQTTALTGKLVLIEHDVSRQTQQPAWPPQVVAFAQDGRNSCVANFLGDPDAIIRRIPLSALEVGGGWVNHTFALRLAELASEQELGLQDGDWNWKGSPLPLRQDSLRINFPGPAGTFPRESLAKLLQDPSRLAQYKGCIVLIVPDFPYDRHATPFGLEGGHRSLGGEIHAAALNTVLTGRYLRRLSPLHWSLWLGCGGLLAALTGAYAAPLIGLAVVALAGLTALVLGGVLFVFGGWLVPFWSTALALSAGLASGWVGRFLVLEQHGRSLRQTLSRMVSRQVADAVIEQRTQRAERRQITLLFSDINGFTPTCERCSPEQVLTMLNVYFDEMVGIIDRHGGYVKQFVGDEIMAIYGALEPVPSHPRHAVLTAIEMLDRLKALQARDPQGDQGFYSVKIGINTGEAVLGSVGSRERWEYAAVGDDVNLAARLESLTTKLGVDVLVSRFTRELVGELPAGWQWKSLGVQKFKGKTSELEVFTLERSEGASL